MPVTVQYLRISQVLWSRFVMIVFRILDCSCYCNCCHCGSFCCTCFLCRGDRKANEDTQQSTVDHHSFGFSYHTTRGDATTPFPSYSTSNSKSIPIAPGPTILITIRATTTLPWRGNSSSVLTSKAIISMATRIEFNELASTTSGCRMFWRNDV